MEQMLQSKDRSEVWLHEPGGANVLVSRSSRGYECLRTALFPPNRVREEVRPLRGPEAREDSRSTNLGCRLLV
jgi:hypothetical protein